MNNDISKGIDLSRLRAVNVMLDRFFWDFHWTCEKWDEEVCQWARDKFGIVGDVSSAILRPHAQPVVAEVHGNSLTNVGIARLENLLIAAGGQGYDATHSRIGVGDDSTAFSASQTDLVAASGSSHRQFKVMNSTYPQGPTAQVLTWQSDFTSGEANFHWQEWCIDVGGSNGTTVSTPMLNRKAEDLGTKTTGTWTLSGAVTIA